MKLTDLKALFRSIRQIGKTETMNHLMKIHDRSGEFRAKDEEGNELTLHYTNRGEPYREGVELYLEAEGRLYSIFLESREAIGLRNKLLEIMPDNLPVLPNAAMYAEWVDQGYALLSEKAATSRQGRLDVAERLRRVAQAISVVAAVPASQTWAPQNHWDNHPDYPADSWFGEVAANETRLGYVEWVNAKLQAEEVDKA